MAGNIVWCLLVVLVEDISGDSSDDPLAVAYLFCTRIYMLEPVLAFSMDFPMIVKEADCTESGSLTNCY